MIIFHFLLYFFSSNFSTLKLSKNKKSDNSNIIKLIKTKYKSFNGSYYEGILNIFLKSEILKNDADLNEIDLNKFGFTYQKKNIVIDNDDIENPKKIFCLVSSNKLKDTFAESNDHINLYFNKNYRINDREYEMVGYVLLSEKKDDNGSKIFIKYNSSFYYISINQNKVKIYTLKNDENILDNIFNYVPFHIKKLILQIKTPILNHNELIRKLSLRRSFKKYNQNE